MIKIATIEWFWKWGDICFLRKHCYIYLCILESAAALPENWSVMNKTENLKVVTLQTTDQEYQNVAQQFSNTGGANFNIIRVSFVV